MAPSDTLTAGWYNVFYTAATTVAGGVTDLGGLFVSGHYTNRGGFEKWVRAELRPPVDR